MVMTDLNKILTVPKILEDSQSEDSEMETTEMKYEVEVQAGKRVVDFVEELDKKHNLALKMMGNYAGQTVGGVASTSTHGSGWFSGTMVRLIEWSNKNKYIIVGCSCGYIRSRPPYGEAEKVYLLRTKFK